MAFLRLGIFWFWFWFLVLSLFFALCKEELCLVVLCVIPLACNSAMWPARWALAWERLPVQPVVLQVLGVQLLEALV